MLITFLRKLYENDEYITCQLVNSLGTKAFYFPGNVVMTNNNSQEDIVNTDKNVTFL